MDNNYSQIFKLIEQAQISLSKETNDTIELINKERNDKTLQELFNYVNQKDQEILTYSHS